MTRGEVVEVDWPYSDMTGSKKRPAVVAQADFLNGLIDDTILVQITGTRPFQQGLKHRMRQVTVGPHPPRHRK